MSRLMTMLGMAGTPLGEGTMATMIARAVHIVVQVARLADGRRRIIGIAEVLGHRGAEIPLHPVFAFERTGTAGDGGVLGQHTQIASSMLTDQFRAAGVLAPARRWVGGGGADSGAAAAHGEIG
jgi:pilus assembly protein CpaF